MEILSLIISFLLIYGGGGHQQSKHSCSNHLCMTWKIQNDTLILNCKIYDITLSVYFFDPFGNEQGLCLLPYPKSKCHAFYTNATLFQNIKTRETILEVHGKIDRRVNGNWICKHGSQKDQAKVEVTVPDAIRTYLTLPTIESDCGSVCVFWTLIGLFILRLPVTVVNCVFSCSPLLLKKRELFLNGIKEKFHIPECVCIETISAHIQKMEPQSILEINQAITMIFVVIVLLIAYFGCSKKEQCSGQHSFIAVGVVVGIVCQLLHVFCIFIKTEYQQDSIKDTDSHPKEYQTVSIEDTDSHPQGTEGEVEVENV